MFKKIFCCGLVLICVLIGIFFHNRQTYVGEKVDPLTYFDEFNNNENNLVYEDQRVALTEPVLVKNGTIYVSYDFAHDYVSSVIFYDPIEKVMTLTSEREIVKLYEGDNQITYGNITGNYELLMQGDILYVSSNLIEDLCGVTIKKGGDERLYIATNESITQKVATIKRKASLRTHARDKANVLENLAKGEEVYVYSEEDGFTRVRSENGIIGYLPSKDLKNEIEVAATKTLPQVEGWKSNPLGEEVKLVWDQMTTRVEVNWNSNKYKNITHANVISPTWFEFGDEEGNLIERCTTSYVETAHAKGLEVWPLLSHSYSNSQLTKEILSSTTKRQRVINQIVAASKKYGFDGINIDIENIQVETSDVWVQFVRELYPQMKSAGLTVSIDVYMPSDWSMHYERSEVAKNADYFIVMAYDQHWSGSEKAGSVAEIPWVEQGINNTLLEVPKEKLVLGVPFYTRVWLESSDGLSVSSRDMPYVEQLVASWGITPTLDEASGQFYVESHREEGTYKIWLEDYTSLKKRIQLVEKYDLAGFAAWKLGLESSEVWEVLK